MKLKSYRRGIGELSSFPRKREPSFADHARPRWVPACAGMTIQLTATWFSVRSAATPGPHPGHARQSPWQCKTGWGLRRFAKGPSGNKCFTSRLVRPRRRDRRRPSVHVFPLMVSAKTWMVGPSPTMTMKHEPCLNRFTYSSTGPNTEPGSLQASLHRHGAGFIQGAGRPTAGRNSQWRIRKTLMLHPTRGSPLRLSCRPV